MAKDTGESAHHQYPRSTLPAGDSSGCRDFIQLVLFLLAAMIIGGIWLTCNNIVDYFKLTPTQKTQKALMAHIWICDSSYLENKQKVELYHDPKSEWEFSEKTFSSSTSFFFTDFKDSFELHDTNKLYYWRQDGTKEPHQYLVIKQLDNTSLITIDGIPGFPHTVAYFHAK